METVIKKNSASLNQELKWLSEIIDARMKSYFGGTSTLLDLSAIAPPNLTDDDSFYAEVVKRDNMNFSERIILLLALLPHIKPELLDIFLIQNEKTGMRFTEFGGSTDSNCAGFIPNGETAAFILAANDLENRFKLFAIFCEDHFFHTRNILHMEKFDAHAPYLSGTLKMSLEYLSYFTIGISKFTSQGT